MKNVLLGAGCLLAALTATALPGEIAPGIDAAHSLAYTVDNDAAGLAPVAEWDDLRTFGMNLSVGLHPSLALHADYQSLTWRSDSPGNASRIDSLSLCLSGILARQSAAGFRLAARGSVGASLFGNLGGMALQGGYHQRVGIERPFPVTYDQYSSAALSLSLSTEASLQRWLARPALFVSAEGNVPGSWQVQGGARVSLGSAGHSADAWALYRHQTLAGLSPTLDRVSALSRGAVAGFEIAASVLTCAAELNMSTGISRSAVGIHLGPGRPWSRGEATADQIPLALELHIDPTMADTGCRVLVPLAGSGLRVFADTFIGWQSLPGSSTTGLRSAEYGAGIEGRVSLPMGRLEGELALGLAPVAAIVTVQPLCMERSCLQDLCLTLALRLEPSLRICLVDRPGPGMIRKTGLGIALAVEPTALTLVPFSSWPAADRRAFALRFFVFGESL